MTIPKGAAPSQVADMCNEQALTFHYPIKKRRQPRQLRPNLEAIRYLEIESEMDTEIVDEYFQCDAAGDEGFEVQRASGWFAAKRRSMYPRPMFQVFDLDVSSSSQVNYTDPCPDCDDWSRTARCEKHHDRDGVGGLRMGAERRAARAAGRGETLAYYSEPEPRPYDMIGLAEMYQQIIEATRPQAVERRERVVDAPLCTCPLCTDFWDRRRAGAVRGHPVTMPEVSADARLSEEWERQNGVPLADVLRQIDRVPSELGPVRPDWLERINSLQSGTIEISGSSFPITDFRMEVNGETVQGIQSFTIHVEARDDDTTA